MIQGASLPWLIRRLHVSDPREAEQEREEIAYAQRIARAYQERAARAAELRAQQEAVERDEQQAAQDERRGPFGREAFAAFAGLGQDILVTQRNALISERDAGRLDDEVMRSMLEQLDLQEAFLAQRRPPP